MEGQQPNPDLQQARRRLGRGLNSLLGSGMAATALANGVDDHSDPALATGEPGDFLQIAVESIERNPYQPRLEFNTEALNELQESIAQHGVLQPLLVRALPSGYQLIAGERRLIASKKAGLQTVPCRIVEIEERAVCEVAIVENLQRVDLNELEKAKCFQDYLDKFGGTIEELARKIGKDRSTVSNALRLLELPEFVKQAVGTGKISAGHARALLQLEEEADQIAMCQRIQSESLSVRVPQAQVRENLPETILPLGRAAAQGESKEATGDSDHSSTNHHVLSLQQQLRDLLGAKVEIRMKGKSAGKMIIHFGTNEEFDHIVGFLKKAG